jgi:Zn-dependent M28 family amino/carboxypeptidase
MLPVQGWITLDTAKDLFARAGLDYAKLKATADRPGFKAVAMKGETLDVSAHSTVTSLKTRNVVGVLRGAKTPDDVVIFSGHWDHLGRNDAALGPDKIFNGAVDNGTGVAQTLELAEKLSTTNGPSAPSPLPSGPWRNRACWDRNISPNIRSGRKTISWPCSTQTPTAPAPSPMIWRRPAPDSPSWKMS